MILSGGIERRQIFKNIDESEIFKFPEKSSKIKK